MWTYLKRTWEQHGETVVGGAFFSGLGFLLFFTIFLGKIDWRAEVVHIPVRLASAEGLRTGVPVFVHGVEVGTVGNLYYVTVDEFDRPRSWAEARKSEGGSHGQTVIAILHMRRNLPFYPNYEVVTRYQTILSEKVVEVGPGGAYREFPYGKQRRPEHGPEGTPLQTLNHLTFTTAELERYHRTGEFPEDGRKLLRASNYDDPLYLIASVIVENRRPLRQITGNLRDITDKLNRGNQNIALLVNQAQLMDGSNGFLREVIVLTQELREGVEDTRESRAAIDFLNSVLAFSGLLI